MRTLLLKAKIRMAEKRKQMTEAAYDANKLLTWLGSFNFTPWHEFGGETTSVSLQDCHRNSAQDWIWIFSGGSPEEGNGELALF